MSTLTQKSTFFFGNTDFFITFSSYIGDEVRLEVLLYPLDFSILADFLSKADWYSTNSASFSVLLYCLFLLLSSIIVDSGSWLTTSTFASPYFSASVSGSKSDRLIPKAFYASLITATWVPNILWRRSGVRSSFDLISKTSTSLSRVGSMSWIFTSCFGSVRASLVFGFTVFS